MEHLMYCNDLQRFEEQHNLKAYDGCSLEGMRVVRLAQGCTAVSSVAGYHVLQALQDRNSVFDLTCGLQEGAQPHEYCWGMHRNCREGSEASVLEACSSRRKASSSNGNQGSPKAQTVAERR